MYNNDTRMIDAGLLRDDGNNATKHPQTNGHTDLNQETTCSLVTRQAKNYGGTGILTSGKLLQHIGQLLFGNSLGESYLGLSKKVNQVTSDLFIAAGLIIIFTTRIHSVFEKVKKKCNCGLGVDAQDKANNDHESTYIPLNRLEKFIYHTIYWLGIASGVCSVANSLLSAMLLYSHLEHTDQDIVHVDDIQKSPGLLAVASYVAFCTATTFTSFKLHKVNSTAQETAKDAAAYFYPQDYSHHQPSEQVSSISQKLKSMAAYLAIGFYVFGYSIFSKVGTEQSILALGKVLGHGINEGPARTTVGILGDLSMIPAISTTLATSGRGLMSIINPPPQESVISQITLAPREWTLRSTLLFFFIGVAGIIDAYANFMGFLGSMINTLESDLGLEHEDVLAQILGWSIALLSIPAYWALNGAESLDTVFGKSALMHAVDSEAYSLENNPSYKSQDDDTSYQNDLESGLQFKRRDSNGSDASILSSINGHAKEHNHPSDHWHRFYGFNPFYSDSTKEIDADSQPSFN